MRRLIPLLGVPVLALGLAAIGSAPARAQEGQPLDSPCVTGVTVQPLAQGMPSDAPGKALAMLRLTIAPGGGFAPHTHPGTVAVSIESGTVEFTNLGDHPMSVMRAASGSNAAGEETLAQGQAATLRQGDWFAEPEMVHSAFNTGGAPAKVLVSGLVAADQPFVQCVEGTPAA